MTGFLSNIFSLFSKKEAVFPFDEVILLYEGSDFLVGFGKNTRNRNKYSVGLRWKNYKYTNSGDTISFPFNSKKQDVWFMIPIHLSIKFLETLRKTSSVNKDVLEDAIKILKEQK
ncbi:hypothetical protein DCO58_00340 [Helicobacter saguini]|uniref:Uncharacterized protein n=1 Tax=Helicobacter saguini TaxID=1548018 RepID=A0A347VQU2_9HELI|nr:hypothetical protein [Helicobacter saguini]MWV63158.1 hypothetical protein [Helicobacter saguini]MWV66172.1 hypothetical protein [Helicobacter saguini]MWV68521.1 hypothetical protein [Helicobacter saguini]MWV71924.1 hypothetical protein [Helicobacter saguini]TLD95936.1 hypothetical protein LS64_000815 [Helicobacter saguini]